MIEQIGKTLPGVLSPDKRIAFRDRMKWTGIILLLYLVMGQVMLYGVSPQATERFQYLEMILGSAMGSLISLGIGPIVTASIILQLLVGSGILNWNLQTHEGREKFQSTQKVLTVFFCIFEAYAYVAFGAVQPVSPSMFIFFALIFQLAFGGFLILLMDEVVSKWGIGSGVSLFIAAGVTKTIFVKAFNPLIAPGFDIPSGLVPQIIHFLSSGMVQNAIFSFLPLLATLLVFLIVVYVQAIKVEIPLALGSISGFGRRWPLKFIYTSNIPVILTAALLANLQLVGSMLANQDMPLLGSFDENGNPVSGLLFYLSPARTPQIQVFSLLFGIFIILGILIGMFFVKEHSRKVIFGSVVLGFFLSVGATIYFVGFPELTSIVRVLTYLLFMMAGATLFSIFWVYTAGMDAHSVAEQIQSIGMQIPGFRRDPRIIEQVLNRYIPVLAVLGGLFVGLVAAFADFTGALGTGTGILLTVMIIYNFYEQISTRYLEEMNPMVRKFFAG